jgi:hypothetical protein
MTRYWTCRRQQKGVKCGTRNPRVKRKCVRCGGSRPAQRKPAHARALDEGYDGWVARYGERCGICGATRKARRLDRDHWHSGPRAGKPRGLLCHRCNRALPDWITEAWLRAAADYINQARAETT